MTDTTFQVSPDDQHKNPHEKVDYAGKLRIALRRPIEATWLPREPLIACDDNHVIPSSFTSVPLTVYFDSRKTQMRLVGGLLGVTQTGQTLEVEPACGWALVYEEPIDPLSVRYQLSEDRQKKLNDD